MCQADTPPALDDLLSPLDRLIEISPRPLTLQPRQRVKRSARGCSGRVTPATSSQAQRGSGTLGASAGTAY
jgi:hypothetical protein